MDLFRSTLQPVEKALADAKMDKGSIHDVVLVGGSTRIPKIQKMLQVGYMNDDNRNDVVLKENVHGTCLKMNTAKGFRREQNL